VPVVAIVDGMRIMFYAKEHWPAHFHVRIAEYHAVFSVSPVRRTEGTLPRAKERKIIEWAQSREAELKRAFEQAIGKQKVDPIK